MIFKLVNIVFILAAAAVLLSGHASPAKWWYFALLALAYISVVFVGCIKLSLGFFIPALCNGNTGSKQISITFDDGPHDTYTPQILDILRAHNVPAAFFCIGKNIAGREQILQRVYDEGHIIGNHSDSHSFWFDMLGSGKMLADMQQMGEKVYKVTQQRPALFRPPYGVMNPNLAKAIKRGGYTTIGWSLRSFDTAIKDGTVLQTSVLKKVRNGDVILLHDIAITAGILPGLIDELKARGFEFVRIDKMLNVQAYV